MRALDNGDPSEVGPYELLGRLGSGGMGRVYLARSPGLRLVALKVVHAHLARTSEFRARFAREVAIGHRVGGVHTASVVDADTEAPVPWLATEYLDGPTLQQAVREHGPLPEPELRALAAALAEALDAIHRVGLVHRDFKPGNIILTATGPRVIDFGIAKALDAATATHTGRSFGTPAFISPEQAEGADAAPQSDIFALGSVLTFAGTGSAPFGSGAASTVLYRVVHGEPTLTGLPEGGRGVVHACLDKRLAHRPTAASVLSMVGGPQAATWQPGAGISALIRRQEEQTRALTASAGKHRAGGLLRFARHPATLGATAVLVTGAVAIATVGIVGLPGAPDDAGKAERVPTLEPAAATQIDAAIDHTAAGAVWAVSPRGTRYATVTTEADPQVITVDLDNNEVTPWEDPGIAADPAEISVADGASALFVGYSNKKSVSWFDRGGPPQEPNVQNSGSKISDHAFSLNAQTSASVGGSASVHYLSVQDGRFAPGTNHHSDDLLVETTAVGVAPDGSAIASGGADRAIQIFDIEDSGSTVGRTDLSFNQIERDTKAARTTVGPSGNGSNRTSPDETAPAWAEEADPTVPSAIALTSNAEQVAFAIGDVVYLWDGTSKGKPKPLPMGPDDGAFDSVAFAPDGGLVAASGAEGAVNVWATRSQERVATMAKPPGSAPIAFTEDGESLRAVDATGRSLEWDVSGLT